MTTINPKDDAFHVPDSTDWLSTPLSAVSAVESALRCQVCKDFYNTPMITSCSHTFCSVCIRRCLSNDGKCPACRTNDQELKLRFNGAMEEVVQAFVSGRDAVLEYARTPRDTDVADKKGKKRFRGQDHDEIEDTGVRKRTRASTRQASSQRVTIVDSEEDGEEYLPEGYVHCPICNKEVKEETINSHIDRNCEDEAMPSNRKSSFQTAPKIFTQTSSKNLERLPQINYSMMKDGPLRKKLADAGLSAAGNRQLMIQRYSEWVTLWNANCDATKPKSRTELKREMDMWERTQGGRATGGHVGAQIRDKDFDGEAWSTKHDVDFKNLIANARKKVVKPSEDEENKGSVDLESSSVKMADGDNKNSSSISFGKGSVESLEHNLTIDQGPVIVGNDLSRTGSLGEGQALQFDHDQHPSQHERANVMGKYSRAGPDIASGRPLQS